MSNALKESDWVPPVPDWRPSLRQQLEQIIERFQHYTDGKKDFAVLQYGTCIILPDGLSVDEAESTAKDVLMSIFKAHPDMDPCKMDDGNILVRYNHPAFNIVLREITDRHWAEIDRNHQRALATSEVLITPLGSNMFDDFGKKALFGRCYMFMDAQQPIVERIVRKMARVV